MTEAIAEATEAEPTETKRRGRPRPNSTVEQDQRVLAVITEAGKPVSRDEIAEITELPSNKVYLSLWRLKNANFNEAGENVAAIKRVRDGGAHKWVPADFVAPEAPAEVPASE